MSNSLEPTADGFAAVAARPADAPTAAGSATHSTGERSHRTSNASVPASFMREGHRR